MITAEPIFHADWFSDNIPHLEKYLGHLKNVSGVRGLEIGCWEGKSSVWFLQTILTGEGARLDCVDNFKGNPENSLVGYERDVQAIFRHNVQVLGLKEQVNLWVGNSSDILRTWCYGSKFDFVYVDGSHDSRNVLIDLCLAWLLLKSGGIMVMDDYGMDNTLTGLSAKPAIDAFYHVFKKDVIELHHDYQVVWRKI